MAHKIDIIIMKKKIYIYIIINDNNKLKFDEM